MSFFSFLSHWEARTLASLGKVATMGRYPDLQPALPTSFVKPSRTSRILQPEIVLATVVILGCSFLSITYLIFHAFAATYNEPVGVVRPPELKLHAACFILARMLLPFWFSTFIAAMITLSKPNLCMKGSRDCHLQVADVVSSIMALIATGIVLTALEACKYPFQVPNFVHIKKKITVRGSSSGKDFLDRSGSRASSFDNINPFETEKIDVVKQKPGTKRKPDAERMSDNNQASVERPLMPLL
ncbi:hypothetical protein NA56DRAFT_658739 [Hyaloscypha hepaticicola]|uniref:Uncharacterized protein n=1 Tax=Hyaloscypha hepaticicola TaxID=2082293 RepID=A0A2J6Q5Z2_9HELO|nr:hypothetical protein NA56DRAFT_658739 [Hyaloscypha hepaticicola]